MVLAWPSAAVSGGEVVRQGLRIRSSNVTGNASFVTAADGGAIPVAGAIAGGTPSAESFVAQYGQLFGVSDRTKQLVVDRVQTDAIGYKHTSFTQIHRGVRVFGGVIKVHQDARGDIRAANGDFYAIPDDLSTTPRLSLDEAVAKARQLAGAPAALIERAELTIVDPGWYGDPVVGAQLAYHVVLFDASAGIREAFFISARSGKVLDRWNLELAKNRRVTDDTTGSVVRVEGGGPTGDYEVDGAYDWAGDLYDYMFRAFGRDSTDDSGRLMDITVHLNSSSCPNAFGGGGSAWFCDGTVTDDVVAHEFGHSVTDFTGAMIYQNQPGQLNESFSDVFGEIVDLLNGDVIVPGAPGGLPGPAWPATATGSGTDTPNDARTACIYSTLMTINAPPAIAGDYGAQAASFGPALTLGGVTGDIVVADPARACDIDLPFTNAASMAGKIVLVDRGDCFFTEKVRNAQDEGAIAVIVANNVSSGMSPMGGSDASITIPSVGSTQGDGDMIKNAVLTDTVNVTLRAGSDNNVRWLVGEDASAFGGAIRDMWQPSCAGDPDTANDPLETCNPDDGGGVHSGSGVPNHAFAMVVDGDDFNGYTINSIGLFKAGAVWYRALSTYLTPTSDFEDAYAAINQAAQDLVGTTVKDPRDGSDYAVFTSADAAEVDKALLAVEMNTPGACGRSELLDTTAPTYCIGRTFAFFDDFETGFDGWTLTNTSPPTPYDWEYRSSLPFGRAGSAMVGPDYDFGGCGAQDQSAVHSLISPVISVDVPIPRGTLAGPPKLAFTHYVGTEAFYDGGNVSISVDGAPWQLIPKEAFTYNAYNGALALDNSNPYAGQPAFTGFPLTGAGWGTSIVDLESVVNLAPGQTIQLKFDLSKDMCGGGDGWYVDDVQVYLCTGVNVPDPVVPEPDPPTNRYLRFSAPGAGGAEQAIRVRFTALDGFPLPNPPYMWVGEPFEAPEEDSGQPGLTFTAAPLICDTPVFRDWSTLGVISVFGAEITPGSAYEVQRADISCPDLADEGCFSTAVVITTGKFGDVAPPFANDPGAPPQPDFNDIAALVSKFLASPGAPIKAAAQLQPNVVFPMRAIDFRDISADVSGFLGLAFPILYPGPCTCPSSVTCGATSCTNDLNCPGGLCVEGFCADLCGRCSP